MAATREAAYKQARRRDLPSFSPNHIDSEAGQQEEGQHARGGVHQVNVGILGGLGQRAQDCLLDSAAAAELRSIQDSQDGRL